MGEPIHDGPMAENVPQMMDGPQSSPYFDGPLVDAPVAAPVFNGTQPYVIANYVIGGMDLLLLVVSVLCVALQLRKKKGLRDGGPSMLFIHVGLFAAARGILVFLPPRIYLGIQRNPAVQTILNIIPEVLFLSIFVILNCMWTEIFLRIRKVNREVTRKIFLWSYFIGIAFLLVGGIILVVAVKATNLGVTANLPLEAQASTYENIYYGVSALILLVANIIFGFGVLRRLPNLTPAYTQRLFSKIKKIQALVVITFCCVIVKVIFLFVMQSALRRLFREGTVSRDAFGVIWFSYLFFTEIVAIVLILSLFLFRRPTKSGKAYLGGPSASGSSSAVDQTEYNEYTNLMRVRQY